MLSYSRYKISKTNSTNFIVTCWTLSDLRIPNGSSSAELFLEGFGEEVVVVLFCVFDLLLYWKALRLFLCKTKKTDSSVMFELQW